MAKRLHKRGLCPEGRALVKQLAEKLGHEGAQLAITLAGRGKSTRAIARQVLHYALRELRRKGA